MEIEIGGHNLSIEVNKIANVAESSSILRYGDTVTLVTLCTDTNSQEPLPNFLPLTCDYLERMYAVGRIPGGFFKRESKPTDKEILTARLIDRPIRPIISKDWHNPIQIISTVLSYDKENDGDILGIIGGAITLRLSSVPFSETIGAVRIGCIGNKFIVNPTNTEMEASNLDLVIVGTKTNVIMIEASCKEVKEEKIIEAIKFAFPEIQKLIKEIEEKIPLGEKLKINKNNQEIKNLIEEKFLSAIENALYIKEKPKRRKKIKELESEIIASFGEKYKNYEIIEKFENIQREIVRRKILEEKKRIDGRSLSDIRNISCEIGVLPRAHGSAIFTRGETQSLCTVTLGTMMDEQKIEKLTGETFKSFMVHYNFPPFSTGEVKRLQAPGRREIGHGYLAERALEKVLPSQNDFPYTIRIVSDVLSSNGSSSMATVCGGSLALMDAGIPIKEHVAGIALGLVDDLILVDIIGEEDHFGDMDFKIAGTREGITAIQLDVKKESGISIDLIEKAIKIGKEARFYILEKLYDTISFPQKKISMYAPKLTVISVPKDKIPQIIGPGGKVVREIIEKTNAKIEISNEGKVTISSDSWETTEAAKNIIEGIVSDVEVGRNYICKVKRILPFGVIVEIFPGKEGMVHISELANRRIRNIEDEVKIGEEIACKVINVDEQGRIFLSKKALMRY